jgi:FkbM family methyltransferase
MVKPGANAICVGAGEDISLDVELNKKGLNVFTLDPTPRSKAHVATVLAATAGGPPANINRAADEIYDLGGFNPSLFTYLDVGLWKENVSMRFFAPKDETEVSHSIVNLQHTDRFFEAKCMTLQSVLAQLDIRHVDILKLDIEGSEYAVVANIVEDGLRPKVLCVEFDELRNPLDSGYMGRILGLIELLKSSGYQFRHLEASNALFIAA